MKFVAPHGQRLSFPLKRQEYIIASIIALFGTCGPSTILWTVTLTVVSSFQRMSFWRIAHIGKKVFKFSPARADSNTAFTIVPVTTHIGIGTTLYHRIPFAISSRMDFAVSCKGNKSLSVQTSTALCVSPLQESTDNNSLLSATALAKPTTAFEFISTNETQDRQTAKNKAGKITKIISFWQRLKRNVKIIVGHVTYSPVKLISDVFRLGLACTAPFRAISILALFTPKMEVYYR